ncbi:MAG TPA: twin-arginine translocation signal domain-containing protein [Parafilimonas sp.]|nr:twin-arginine translocation signal domain-containing protein [Parafilimonas sp.]
MKNKNRRNFLKALVSSGAVAGLATPVILQEKEEKVKMLTPDGKLVEVNKSVIEKNAGVKKATDKEVFDWMDPKHKA